MAATATAARTRTINIRIEEERRTLIDRAAEAAGKDRTQFVLDAATREATTVLLDQRYFQLDTRAGFYECRVDPMMILITLAVVEKNLTPPSAS